MIDIANARIEFADGAVADLSASRVSRNPVRKLRVFGTNFYASADLNVPELRVERKPAPKAAAAMRKRSSAPMRCARRSKAFVATASGKAGRIVSGSEGRAALALALEVNHAIFERIERFSRKSGDAPA